MPRRRPEAPPMRMELWLWEDEDDGEGATRAMERAWMRRKRRRRMIRQTSEALRQHRVQGGSAKPIVLNVGGSSYRYAPTFNVVDDGATRGIIRMVRAMMKRRWRSISHSSSLWGWFYLLHHLARPRMLERACGGHELSNVQHI
eukprot:4126881-Pyramimonas_sp.AAC.3